LKSELAGLRLERRLVRDKGQLVLNESAKRLGNEVELPGKLLVGPAQAVQPPAEPFVELSGAAPLDPSTKGVREDRCLRRAWFGSE
jgi:hypothetical protein